MAKLSFQHLDKIYSNNVQAVYDFNLEVKDKEFIVFVGPSGCGKSTTLRMVAGLEAISNGELYIDNIKVNDVDPMDRDIAMVFQNYALYPHMTVYNNIAFALKLRKMELPIYREDPQIEILVKKMDEVYKEVKAVDRKFKKDQNSQKLLDQHIALYDKIFELDDKIKSLRVQLTGINETAIKLQEKKIISFKKEIKTFDRLLASYKKQEPQQISILNQKLEKFKEKNIDPKAIEEFKKDIEETKLANRYEILNLEQKQKERDVQLKEMIDKYESLKKSVVPLTKVRHLTKREIDIEINRTSATIDLTKYLFRKPAALSGGQRQRVALGRAIVRNPKVFLMDEPLSNLDAKLRVQTRTEITKLHERIGATTIYVTHDQTEAMTMADRIVIMKAGFIQQIGEPKKVYRNPLNIFVAGFIGSPSMNFFDGSFDGKNFKFDGPENLNIKLNAEFISLLKNFKERKIVLGIRPEDFFIEVDKAAENKSNPIKIKCDVSELLGHELAVYGKINGQKVVIKTSAKYKIDENDINNYVFNEKHIHFFDKETGKCIDYVDENGQRPFAIVSNLVKDPSDDITSYRKKYVVSTPKVEEVRVEERKEAKVEKIADSKVAPKKELKKVNEISSEKVAKKASKKLAKSKK